MSSIVKAKNNYIYPAGDESKNIIDRAGLQLTEIDREKELILNEAVRKSKSIKEAAEKSADSIVVSALEESSIIRFRAEQQGYNDGYTRGLADGSAEARKRAESGLEEVRTLLTTIRNERKEAFSRNENDMIILAFEMAKKILRQQIEADEGTLILMLEDILHEHEHENDAMVKICMPEYMKSMDLSMDKTIAKKIKEKIKNVKVTMTKTEDSITIETENGVIDASIPVQLEQLRQAIDL
ncbi:hypothetical protein MASR2M70_19460 [Bacillota bacterium]